jgi:hypothetical protein
VVGEKKSPKGRSLGDGASRWRAFGGSSSWPAGSAGTGPAGRIAWGQAAKRAGVGSFMVTTRSGRPGGAQCHHPLSSVLTKHSATHMIRLERSSTPLKTEEIRQSRLCTLCKCCLQGSIHRNNPSLFLGLCYQIQIEICC